jgi:hypothetical protein
MTQEVLKLALGALEDFVDVIKYDNEQDDIGRRACCDVLSYNPHSESCKAIKSIASLRQAIAELESQEPVATVTSETGADITMSWWHEPALPVGTKLFTHQPQRTWVGLTDEEIEDIVEDCDGVGWDVAQAIRAKLKEKNT